MILIWFFFICFFSNSTSAQQFYDPNSCSSNTIQPGSRYTIINSSTLSCQTFIVYRARPSFQSISQISTLFSSNPKELLRLNTLTSPSHNLTIATDVLIPITCSSSGKYFQANFSYRVSQGQAYSDIACGVFAGLVKSITLVEENAFPEDDIPVGALLRVPLRCACPDEISSKNGVKYLVTYPFVEGDGTIKLSEKFGIPAEELWAANHFSTKPTVYAETTFLVPLKKNPVIYLNESTTDHKAPILSFLPTVPLMEHQKESSSTGQNKLFIAGIVLAILLVLLGLLVIGLCVVKSSRKLKAEKLDSSITATSSPASRLSPDLLSMCRFSLCHYSTEELNKATSNFSQDNKRGSSTYMGRLDDHLEVIVKEMKSEEETRRIVNIYSKINHINILQLLGVSYGSEESENCSSNSFLVFEFAGNGSLQDCLFNSTHNTNLLLQWKQRKQIAFDIATALHYFHHCTIPAYAHMSINSRNVLITEDRRARIANFETTTTLAHGSSKVDVFAFGVVLFEMISGQEAVDHDGRLLRDWIKFMGGSESGYFDQLRWFVDPRLKDDYSVAEALCLAVLAKACVEDDPLHRPSMNDILKVLSRLVN